MKAEMISMGNFSGWLQRTEKSAVNNALSHLVTDRTFKNKDVLNSFSSLLGNCHLMGHSEHKKSHVFPSLFHWGSGKFLSCPKADSIRVSPFFSCSLAQSIFSQCFFSGGDRVSILLVQQQSWGCSGWWHHSRSDNWSPPCPGQCWVTLGWRHCWRSGDLLQSNAP